jgi:multiple sugar transport system permease protein
MANQIRELDAAGVPSATMTQRSHRRSEAIAGYVFMAPAFVVFLIFLILPIIFALYISFTDWNGITPLGQQLAGATGIVTLTNNGDTPVTINAGTLVGTRGEPPILFETIVAVQVPVGDAVDVEIVAIDSTLGRDTNVRSGGINTFVDESLSGQIQVSNALSTQGGLDQAFDVIGGKNYVDLLVGGGIAQRDFYTSFKNTVYFVIGVVPVQTFLALLLAVIVNQRWLIAKGAFRTAFYFPSITSSVVISIIFMWMFTRGGIVNTALEWVIPNYERITWIDDPSGLFHNFLALFGVDRRNVGDWASIRLGGLTLWEWFSGPSVTLFTIMMLNTWTTIGTLMIIYLAALQNIPGSVYEAASMDGANGMQIFRKITVPLLAPTTYFVITLGLIGTFQVFDQIFVISSGGPAKTTLTIAYIVYENGFNNSNMGLAAATAMILFVIIFAFSLVQRSVSTDQAV